MYTISALKQRDCVAWAGVFEAFADRVYQDAFYRLNADRSAAEDVVQEVFCAPSRTSIPSMAQRMDLCRGCEV